MFWLKQNFVFHCCWLAADMTFFLSCPDGDEGDNSPFPDLSALDEIPQDDWEQMINSSTEELKHLEVKFEDTRKYSKCCLSVL